MSAMARFLTVKYGTKKMKRDYLRSGIPLYYVFIVLGVGQLVIVFTH